MKVFTIDKKEWGGGVEQSGKTYRIIGPAKRGSTYRFAEMEEGELPLMDGVNTQLSPKSILFPPSEVMFAYDLNRKKENHNLLMEVEKDPSPRAVIGIRPCDARAIELVKKNFDTPEYKDPYWLDARKRCTFIGLAVNRPDPLDFSTSCGTGPFDESGLDLLLVDCEERYLAKVVTEKGSEWLSEAGFHKEAEEGAASLIEEMKNASEKNVASKISFDKILERDAMELYNAGFWEELSFGCLNCGTCTYSCPTCWCFDIQDETIGNSGVRMRNWDSCMSKQFALHSSGHNPRETGLQRTRQRFMHKLKYFPDKYNEGVMCVGCGRCVSLCPANIDIREICEKMNRLPAKES